MRMVYWHQNLRLVDAWTISTRLRAGGTGKVNESVLLLELRDRSGNWGYGEAAPAKRYREDMETVLHYLEQVDSSRLSFEDRAASCDYLAGIKPFNRAAFGALDLALADGAARSAKKTVHELFDLGFKEGPHVTSFSIGIDTPEVIEKKVSRAAEFEILKIKLGSPDDEAVLKAVRNVAPSKTLRVDANEAWAKKEEALRRIEWLAEDSKIEFVEQPMPSTLPAADHAWLRERSPLPLMADESYVDSQDVSVCRDAFDAVNVKLVKTGGISEGYRALKVAREAGLKTMLGCMIESSVLISAAAHLAAFTDYLDLDGSLLTANDPFDGVVIEKGVLSFEKAFVKDGLQVRPKLT